MSQRFTFYILGGMILGIIVGYVLYATIPDPKAADSVRPPTAGEVPGAAGPTVSATA